ncbi:MAG: thiamine pyrophosphate-binding protein [Burkholderiaceae bacterium]
MAKLTGSEILARSLKKEGTEDLFFLMGGPMILTEQTCITEGIRMIDVRHEQAAALMAQSYSRLRQRPGVCMAASGPGAINLTTGLANALIDCAPVVAIGGSSPISQVGRQAFQEIDQLQIMRGCVKHSERLQSLSRIPQQVNNVFQQAMAGKPGPTYLDCPGDLLYQRIDEEEIDWSCSGRRALSARPPADPAAVSALVDALRSAKRPIIVSGSGVIWSQAWDELQAFVEAAGIPFYPTPQGRGVLPDDHKLSFPAMRSTAFREADLVLIVGTRMNYMIGYGAAPRFSADATVARIDISAEEIAGAVRPVDIGLVGDCKRVLGQLFEAAKGRIDAGAYASWRGKLADGDASKRARPGVHANWEGDIHPLRLCEEINAFIRRDAVLIVDGAEILNFGRQSMPTFSPGHRMNSGPFGTMGVGLPFGVGAKLAKPDKQVVVVHGDGSFGLNAMELDTAVRHGIPILVVISLNGGWAADPNRDRPGRDLGYTHYEKMAEALGCYGEYVERAEDIGPALQRAQAKVDAGMVAVVNVKTDYRARAGSVDFTDYAPY